MKMMHMEIKTGYLYHIKNEYFDKIIEKNYKENLDE